jgi:L,D-transpeptidase YcbB
MKNMRMKDAMSMRKCFYLFYLLVFILILPGTGCKGKHKYIGQKEIVKKTEELKLTVSEVIKATLEDAIDSNGHLSGFDLKEPVMVDSVYSQYKYASIWTSNGKWLPKGDSLLALVKNLRSYGLYPEFYYRNQLDSLHYKTVSDTSKENKLDASLWARTDMYLTSAFINITAHLKTGRLMPDSIRHRDSTLSAKFYISQLDSFKLKPVEEFTAALEPAMPAYRDLKQALSLFLLKANLKQYSYINPQDTAAWTSSISKRLKEDSIRINEQVPDSLELATAIKQYQRRKGLKPDGRISETLFSTLNNNGASRFAQIAVTLDRYKTLGTLPANYIWVNIPSYRLNVVENDTVVLSSKVVVGKPETHTPTLTSAISDMITYPLWHIPNSIIVKDILPALKKDPGYLKRKGFSLVDDNHNEIDPYTVNWSKYKDGIPYTVIQGSGDDNALGMLKFNFPNKYSVYLHDTNQRSFFSRKKRALSHGCVRVEAWQDLAYYLLDKDSTRPNATPPDSMATWLSLKQKHVIPLKNRVPLFIRYFTCETNEEGEVVFFDDIYGEDRKLWQTYINKQ